MSGHNDIISFDLRHGGDQTIDVRSFFRLTDTHAIDGRKPKLENITPGQGRVYDFSVDKTIVIQRFRTLGTLDLTTRRLIELSPIERKIVGIPDRPHLINLMDPLVTPYGALDVRSGSRIFSSQKYPDLYARRLPASLIARRTWRASRIYMQTHRLQIASLLLTIAIVTVPLLLYARFSIEEGYKSLALLRTSHDINQARTYIQDARAHFERGNFVFFPFSFFPHHKIELADTALSTGLLTSRALDTLISTIPTGSGLTMDIAKSEVFGPLFRKEAQDIFPLAQYGIDMPTDWFRTHQDDIGRALVDLGLAAKKLQSIRSGDALTEDMNTFGRALERIVTSLQWGIEKKDMLLSMLGDEEPVRYIILNQNRDEIRANGGFPGSIISLTLYKGNILDMRKDDIYYYDWNLYPYKEIPPPGLALLTDTYGLRDVNYYPDFRESVEKANQFIERSGDSTITTGIAIHQGFIEDILQKTGPVTLSGVAIPFDSQNFSTLMSLLVENKYAREHSPKDILFHFADALVSKIHEKRLYEDVFSLIESYWKSGEILIASRDERTESWLSEYKKSLPWECRDVSCPKNWVYPLFTSVSGNKSDRYIIHSQTGTTTIFSGCLVENKVTLSLEHTYKKSDLDTLRKYMDTLGIREKSEREKLEFIQGNGKNRDFIRLYVPQGAELAFTGSDIKKETDQYGTVFSWIMETNPGAKTSKTLRYTLPIEDCQSANTVLTWTRQPGIRTK